MSRKPKTLLLVEDEHLVAVCEKLELENRGYNVVTVPTGEKAIDAVAKQGGDPFDLILMDIDLGEGLDGTQAAEAIQSNMTYR